MNTIIGLVGAKKAGKTTAYRTIASKFSNVEEITLAKKLKDVCSEVFKIQRNALDSHSLKEVEFDDPVFLTAKSVKEIYSHYNLDPAFDTYVRPHMGKILFTPRQVAQYVGTEVLRAVDLEIHLKSSIQNLSKDSLGIVTDIRFPNELDFFRNKSARFISFYIKNSAAELVANNDAHESESHLKYLAANSLLIENEGTIADFQDKILKMVGEWLG